MGDPSSVISRQIDMFISRHNMLGSYNSNISHQQISKIFAKLDKKNQFTKNIYIKSSQEKLMRKKNIITCGALKKDVKEERDRLFNSKSLKRRKLRQTSKLRKKSSAEFKISNEFNGSSIKRYNMNKDSKINLIQQGETQTIYKPITPQKKGINLEQKLMRKTRQTENLVKSRKRNALQDASRLSSTLKLKNLNEKFQFQYQIQKPKEYIPKRKFWTSAKVIISRQTSPHDTFTITNTRACSSDKRVVYHRSLADPVDITQTIDQQNIVSKSLEKRKRGCRKQRLTDSNEMQQQQGQQTDAMKKKFLTKGRHCKQLFFNRIFKSKTEGIKEQEQPSICPWSYPQDRFCNQPSIKQYQQIDYYM